jgi:hypothetical protein
MIWLEKGKRFIGGVRSDEDDDMVMIGFWFFALVFVV